MPANRCNRLFLKNATEYRRFNNRLFTEEWQNHQSIQSSKSSIPSILTKHNNVYRMAVHRRCEDIEPRGQYLLQHLSN